MNQLSPTPATPTRIIYLLKMFPRFSETFILNEILGLQELGTDVQVYSLRFSTDGKFHRGLSQVRNPARYAPEFLGSQFHEFASAWFWAARDRPVLFIRTLAEAIGGGTADGLKRWAQGVWLCREFARTPAQGIHVHFADGSAHAAYFLNRLNGNPFTITAHAYDIYTRGKDFRKLARIVRRARGLVTVCDYNRRYLLRRLGRDFAPKIRRIYNGIDLELFTPPPFEERRRDLLLSVSRLVEKKGIDVLIDAVAELRTRGTPVECIIAGEGDREAALRAQVARMNLGDRIRFVGPISQDEVVRLQRIATMMVAPCIRGNDGNVDALPTVLVESLACGTPSITTSVTGIPEIVRHEREGLIVPQRDPVALADAIQRLMGEPDLCERLGRAARQRAEQMFDRKQTVRTLAAHLATVHAES